MKKKYLLLVLRSLYEGFLCALFAAYGSILAISPTPYGEAIRQIELTDKAFQGVRIIVWAYILIPFVYDLICIFRKKAGHRLRPGAFSSQPESEAHSSVR